MTEDEEIQSLQDVFDNPRNTFPAAYAEARHKLSRDPRVRDVVEYGYATWEQLTPAQRTYALDDLFQAYFWRQYEQERAERLDAATKAGETYLQPDDTYWLQDALTADVDVNDPDAVADGVLAGPLHRVLMELELLRHRLAVREQDGGDR